MARRVLTSILLAFPTIAVHQSAYVAGTTPTERQFDSDDSDFEFVLSDEEETDIDMIRVQYITEEEAVEQTRLEML